MKISNYLNILSSIITLLFIIYLLVKNFGTSCFSLFDYLFSFLTLFGNLGISLLSSLGK